MLRAALVLWLTALAGTTALFVLVVSAQQVARWVSAVRRAPQSAVSVPAVSVPAQRAPAVTPERVAA